MIAEIRGLDPGPGAAFGRAASRSRWRPTSSCASARRRWHVELNSDTLPRLLVDQRYHARVGESTTDQEKTFVSDCLAHRQLAGEEPRPAGADDPEGVAEIVRQQDAFLAYGVSTCGR